MRLKARAGSAGSPAIVGPIQIKGCAFPKIMRTDIRLHDEEGRFLYRVTCDQNNEMIAAKQAEAHFNESGQCIGIKLVTRHTRYSRKDFPLNPPSSISASELLANVGITNSEAPNYRAVQVAQNKVSVWPFVWDDRSAPAVVFS